MRLIFGALLVTVLLGCSWAAAVADGGPSLEAFSDSNGALYVTGNGWNSCACLTVDLPGPWAVSLPTVVQHGRFSVGYNNPKGKPFEGPVVATCVSGPTQVVTAKVRVGDLGESRPASGSRRSFPYTAGWVGSLKAKLFAPKR
jgi:hypothetical protein